MIASAIFILLVAILTGAWFIAMDALGTLVVPDRYPDALYRWERPGPYLWAIPAFVLGVVCAVVISPVLMRHLLGARYQHLRNHDQKLNLDDKLLIAGIGLPFAIVLGLVTWGSAVEGYTVFRSHSFVRHALLRSRAVEYPYSAVKDVITTSICSDCGAKGRHARRYFIDLTDGRRARFVADRFSQPYLSEIMRFVSARSGKPIREIPEVRLHGP
jgi:hypothetical protein